MVASSKSREAFDLEREPQAVRDKYGKANEDFLRARRLVEAGISVVTLVVGGWDTHSNNFNSHARVYCRGLIKGCMPWSLTSRARAEPRRGRDRVGGIRTNAARE